MPDATAAPGRDDIIARAHALAPVLRERAGKAERLRRIPDETIRDLHECGLWRVLRPQRYGGWLTDYGVMIEVTAALARGCASTGWVYMNIIAHNWMLPMWPAAAQRDIWDDNPEALIGSTLIFPRGRLDPVDGGYLLTGRWPYASGVDASDWIMLGGMIPPEREDGRPSPRIIIVRVADIEVIDTWHVAGLAATGSKDVACEKLFLPDYMALDPLDIRGGPTPGSEALGPVYRLPPVALIPNLVGGAILGMAQGAYDDFVADLRSKVSIYNASRLADHTTVQLKLAEAGVLIETARLLLRETWVEAHRFAEAGAAPELVDRARWRRDASHAVAGCVRAVDLIYGVNGGNANYLGNALQRHFRDIHAAAGQIHVSWDINGPEFARIELGLPATNPAL